MQKFKTATDLITKIRADIGNRIIPELLTDVAAITTKKVGERLSTKVQELQPQIPPTLQDPRVYKFPPKAVIMMIGEGTPQEIEGYTEVFNDVNESYLRERAKFLILLHEGGIK
jgi:hypothetical protein